MQLTPYAKGNHSDLTSIAKQAWSAKRALDIANLTSHAFYAPALARGHTSLADGVAAWQAFLQQTETKLAGFQREIDDIAYRLYGIGDEDRLAIERMLGCGASATESADVSETDDAPEDDEADESARADAPAFVSELLDYALGAAFGRWDIRYATGARPAPAEPDPFAALPACAPGMLQNAASLPAAPTDVPADYPRPIVWSGIIPDDPHHPDDIERNVGNMLAAIYGSHGDTVIDEAVATLGAASLRDYLRKPAGFFAAHFKRHKKSRRQAPIYWPLSSPKGHYTIWLYYHRLTKDTIFTVVRDYVKPRLDDEERLHFKLAQEAGPTPAPAQARDLAAASELIDDIRSLRAELDRVAPLWNPDLNDGVIINHAPLWRLAALPAWRKALKDTWDALVAGKYDWSHLAMHFWPERVVPKCAADRSLAIAHGLDEFFWATDPQTGEVAAKKRKDSEVAEFVAARTSAAVKTALAALLDAPAPAATAIRRPRKKKS